MAEPVRDPAEERAHDLEAALLDAIEVLCADPYLGEDDRLTALGGRLLELADEIQDARHERGLCACDPWCGPWEEAEE